jgi:serine/threonine-protein kinase PknK
LHVALRRGIRREHELFPGFTDVHEIGVGSLAVVFRGREAGTNRHVALKLLNVRDASPRAIESFERESIALGALSSHPNIVTLFRVFRTPDGRPVLVLELCTGAVADRLHDGTGLPVPEVVTIGIKIAGALETAHRGGILHRDVKPQNILVTDFAEPALADFGVAMLQSSSQTTAGLFDFTTLHAAPELLEGGGTSAATDVYELASSLYQLIAGQSAFRAYEGESPASVILRILRDPVRPLSAAGVPGALSDLLIRAMSKKKAERPPTAAEFAAELADIEITEGWHRTQFLIRDPGELGVGLTPIVTRMPDAVPRGLPSTLAPGGPITELPPVPPESAALGSTTPAVADIEGWAAPPAVTEPTPALPLPAAAPVPPRERVLPLPEPPPVAWAPPATVARPEREPAPQLAPEPEEPPPASAPEPRHRHQAAVEDDGDDAVDVDVDVDEEALPAARPGRHRYIPRHGSPDDESEPTEPAPTPTPAPVPVWAVRSQPDSAEQGAPKFVGELSMEPMSLRPKTTLRAGASSVTVTEQSLQLRTWFKRSQILWTDVQGFEAQLHNRDAGTGGTGQIVALTALGPVEIPGTRRPVAELGYVHALLDAYRIRAKRVANR